MRLAGGVVPAAEHRVQFFALAAAIMRHILVDHARGLRRGRRGGGTPYKVLDDQILIRGSLPEHHPGRQQWGGSSWIDSGGASVYGLAYYDELRHFAREGNIGAPSVLAHVMAHEIGHLAGLKHGPEGIMRAKSNRTDMERMKKRWLCFTELERGRIRDALAARVRAQRPEATGGD